VSGKRKGRARDVDGTSIGKETDDFLRRGGKGGGDETYSGGRKVRGSYSERAIGKARGGGMLFTFLFLRGKKGKADRR